MIEYQMAYNDKASSFLDEIQSFATLGYIASAIQPTVATESVYKYVLLMERSTKPKGEI